MLSCSVCSSMCRARDCFGFSLHHAVIATSYRPPPKDRRTASRGGWRLKRHDHLRSVDRILDLAPPAHEAITVPSEPVEDLLGELGRAWHLGTSEASHAASQRLDGFEHVQAIRVARAVVDARHTLQHRVVDGQLRIGDGKDRLMDDDVEDQRPDGDRHLGEDIGAPVGAHW